MRRPTLVLSSLAVSALAVSSALVLGPAASASTGTTVRTVATHLGNPRGLAMVGDSLYIAESGSGGPACAGPAGSTTCVGLTGKIDRLHDGVVTNLVDGLISVSGAGGVAASGPAGVSVDDGQIFGVVGGNTSGIPPTGFPVNLTNAARAELGQLFQAGGNQFEALAGVGDFDFAWAARHKNLNPQFPDSNPNAVLSVGGERFVVDSGANTLDEVEADGSIRVLTYFGVPKGSVTDAVPTCIAKGPDGAYYVGELLGGTFAPGGARVWRVVIGSTVTKSVWRDGFTTIQGCGFDQWGNFYATEFQTAGLSLSPTASPLGDVIKVTPSGARTPLGTGQLFFPSGFAAGRDGSVYASNCSIAGVVGFGPCPLGGTVVKIG